MGVLYSAVKLFPQFYSHLDVHLQIQGDYKTIKSNGGTVLVLLEIQGV